MSERYEGCERCAGDCRKCTKFPPDQAHRFNPRLIYSVEVIKQYKSHTTTPFSNVHAKPPVIPSEQDYLAARHYIKAMGYKVKGLRVESC